MIKQHIEILKLFIFILAINVIFLFSLEDEPDIIEHNTKVISKIDTVFVTKIDTVFVTKIDTIYLKPKKEIAYKNKKIEKITEDVTENVTGKITKDVTENVTGKITKDVTGKITEDVTENVTEKTTNDISDDEKLCANEGPDSETGYVTEDRELHCYYCYTEINGVCVARFYLSENKPSDTFVEQRIAQIMEKYK